MRRKTAPRRPPQSQQETVDHAISRREAARKLEIDYVTLGLLIARGIIRPTSDLAEAPGFRGSRGSWLFREIDLEAAREVLSGLHWMATVSPASWSRLTADGLSYTLLTSRYGRAADALRIGNRIAFYVAGRSSFAGLATVTGRKINKVTMWPDGVFPFRIPLRADLILARADEVPVKAILSRLALVQNSAHWEMYFRGTIRLIDARDFSTIADAMSKRVSTGSAQSSSRRKAQS